MTTINRRQFNKPVATNKEKKVVRIKLPPAYKFLFKPYRYKSVYGGRGAARSWSIARALLALAAVKPLRILCTRELQTSISDSCYRLLCDQIEACHLSDQYLIQKNAIFSKCGSEFILNKGLRFNINEIKSMEGIDIAWIEEAQSVSEDSWKVLIPTIRKDNSEIWLSWNTGEETDPTYQRFVINKPPECVSVHLTYKDNPYFPEVLNKERLWLKKVDSDAYDHIWEGLPLKISESIIFKGKYEEKEFEAPYGAKFYYGADWGFSNDPTVLLRCFECESNLYIDYGVHGVGVELDEIPALFDAVPNSRDSLIKADSARPETISYIKNKGFPIESCKKWNGSVQDGIAFLRSYNKIYIHPRCQFILDEFKHYSYKKDSKTGEILPVIIDKFNHCFVGETMIETIMGEVAIKDIQAGDLVFTRSGYRRVKKKFENGAQEVKTFKFANNRALTATGQHNVITPNDKKHIEDISFGDELFFIHKRESECKFIKAKNTKRSFLKASLIEDIHKAKEEVIECISRHLVVPQQVEKIDPCIEQYGNQSMALCLQDASYITKTATLSTIRLKIYNALMGVSILPCIAKDITKIIKKMLGNAYQALEALQLNGIEAKREERGIMNMLERWRLPKRKKSLSANIAANLMKLFGQRRIVSVPINVNQKAEERQESITENTNAQYVEKASLQINIPKLRHARIVAEQSSFIEIERRYEEVFNLEIEEHHEYFANGILVANCIDSLRYALEDRIKGETDWLAVVNG